MKLNVRSSALAGALSFFTLVTSVFAEGNSLVITERSFDFGSVPQGAKVAHEFEIQNKGSVDIQLQKFTPSCGCTAASIDNNPIKPGESGKIRVEFDTAGFSGAKTKTVEVLTSDKDSPEIVLTLKGTVVPGVNAEPKRIEFGEISASNDDGAWTKEFSVVLAEGSDLKLEKVSSYSKFIKVTQIAGQGLKTTYKTELSKDLPRGEFRDRVVVEFAGDRQSSLNIPVTASVRGDQRVVPSTVSFGVIEGDEVIERRVKWENSSKSKVSVLALTPSDPSISANFIEIQPGNKGVIAIKIDPQKVSSDVRATVEVKTDHPSEDSLVINVFAVLPPK